MDIDKKIEMLRKRNASLQEENEYLKAQIMQQSKDENRYTELCDQLEVLRDNWEKEIAEIKSLRMKYEAMVGDVKKVKDVLMGTNDKRFSHNK